MSSLNDEDRANLTAYLDGELDEEAAQALEAKLSQDPAARAEVEALKKAWTMLDFLPRQAPSASFTHRTMERLSLERRPVETGRMPAGAAASWTQRLVWAVGVIGALVLGYAVSSTLWKPRDDPDEVIVRHLPLLEKWRAYEMVDDLDFLRALDDPDLFGDDLTTLPATFAAPTEPGADVLAANRRRFEQLQKSPELLAQLRDEAKVFFALPDERRDQIVQLDQALAQEPPPVQARLGGVLGRYGEWLHRLDAAARKQVADAPDKSARLALIRKLREQEWVAAQPRAIRDELAKLDDKLRADRIAQLKRDERQRRIDWLMASRFWDGLEIESKSARRVLPRAVADLLPIDQQYVRDYLSLFLSPEEKDRLAKAEGSWPQFPMTLIELADQHPAALPGKLGPKEFRELPAEVKFQIQKEFKKKDITLIPKALKLPEGAWPDYGTRLAKFAMERGIVFRHEFLAYNKTCLSPAMRQFVEKKLEPVLDGKESLRLANAIGSWPDYPQAIQDLAAAHHLKAPWVALPRNENWDSYRLR